MFFIFYENFSEKTYLQEKIAIDINESHEICLPFTSKNYLFHVIILYKSINNNKNL